MNNGKTDILIQQGNCLFLTNQEKWILKSIMTQENHQHRIGSSDDLDKANPTSPPTHLPFLCCCHVYGVHNVFHSIYYLFSSDSVLFKLGFHGWLRDTLLRGAQATTHYCNSMPTQPGISLSESTCCQFYHELKPVGSKKGEIIEKLKDNRNWNLKWVYGSKSAFVSIHSNVHWFSFF